jgi:hypothetical protein
MGAAANKDGKPEEKKDGTSSKSFKFFYLSN